MRFFRSWSAPAIGAIGFMLALPSGSAAHRLDEYLQATRIRLSLDSVLLEIDLTPGVSVAPGILATIDSNRDDRISGAEADAYASEVVRQVVLEVDGQPQRLRVVRRQFPSLPELGGGTGTIRIEVGAAVAAGGRGRHRLSYRNDHRPDVGVYLVNALVPTTSQIAIMGQQRDTQQRGIRLDYAVASVAIEPAGPIEPVVAFLAVLALVAVASLTFRRTANERRAASKSCLRLPGSPDGGHGFAAFNHRSARGRPVDLPNRPRFGRVRPGTNVAVSNSGNSHDSDPPLGNSLRRTLLGHDDR